jgi:hypothetical protein
MRIRQNLPKFGFFRAQIEKWPHRWIFARTDGKLARTERQSVRTNLIFAAQMGKWPHGTIYYRTKKELFRTDRQIARTRRFSSARSPSGRPPCRFTPAAAA